MARDTIAVTSTVRAGVLPTLSTPVAANNGEFANGGGKTVLVVVNGMGGAGGGTTVVTVQQVECPHERIQNDTPLSVAADLVGVLGPFPPALYNQTDGTVQVDYDATAANINVFGLAVL